MDSWITTLKTCLLSPTTSQAPSVCDKSSLLVPSAVCVPVVMREGNPHLLFTKRSMGVRFHKGQVCFPGGMWEERDGALANTALRETEEELGIPHHAITIIGQLPETITTPTGFHIASFVAVIQADCLFEPSTAEIERLLFAPLHGFKKQAASEGEPRYFCDGELIWGATARIIDQLLRLTIQ